MISSVIFFDTADELVEITGTSEDDLWKNGFNLDDMDWGFVSNDRWDQDLWYQSKEDDGYFMHHILWWMENHCVGYNEVEYNNQWYYTLHHS